MIRATRGRTLWAPLIVALGLGMGLSPHPGPASQLPGPSGPGEGKPLEMRPLRGPRGDVAALLLGGRDGGSLRVAALAVPECPRESGPVTTSFWFEIEAQSLLEAVAERDETELPESIRLELYAYAMTRDGEIEASLAQFVRVDVGELTGYLPSGGVKLATRLELPSGEYQVRALVREPRSQQFGLRVVGVQVPDLEDAGPWLAPPLFPEPSEEWLLVRPSDWGTAQWPPEGLSSALPVLSVDRPHPFSVRGCRLETAELAARLTDLAGRPAGAVELHLEGAVAGDFLRRGRLELPDLAAGIYRIELSSESTAGKTIVALPVFVSPPSQKRQLAWTALGARATALEEPDVESDAESDAESAKGSHQRVRDKPDVIASAYLSVLERLALGQREAALDELVAMQSEIVGDTDKPQRAIKRLDEGKNRVTRQLLDHHPECLLPELVLHLELQERYLEMDDPDPYLLQATRSRIRALAQVYAEEARSEMAANLAALSLVELADVLERAQRRVSALVVLREALSLDPENPEVLLSLAYHFENHGLDREAMAMLERLLEVEPRSDEGRLRLAMGLSRAQRPEDAVQVLERLIRNGTTEWVLAVAYEELGNSLLRKQRFEEAVRLLRQGVGRLPREQRLHLELAYALDRAGERRASRDVMAAMPDDDGRPSPRLRYRAPAAEEDRGAREALLRHTTGRLPLLGQALVSEVTP